MKKSATASKKRSPVSGLLSSSAFGALLGLAVLLVLIALFSAVCLFMDAPHKFLAPLCLFAVFSAAFFCGMAAVKKNRGGILSAGALSGVLFMLLIWLLSAIVSFIFNMGAPSASSLIYKLLLLPSSLSGAFCGMGSSSKKKKRHKF